MRCPKCKEEIEYKIKNIIVHWIVNLMKHQRLDNPAPPRNYLDIIYQHEEE